MTGDHWVDITGCVFCRDCGDQLIVKPDEDPKTCTCGNLTAKIDGDRLIATGPSGSQFAQLDRHHF